MGFIVILIIPFWVSRITLFFLDDSLVIESFFQYFFYTFRFDFKTLAIWYSPLFLVSGVGMFYRSRVLQILSKVLFVILVLAALVLGLIAAFYYPTSKSILGVELFQLLKGQEIHILFGYALSYWPAIILVLALVYSLLKLYGFMTLELVRFHKIIFCSMSVLLLVFLARGGLKLKPLNTLDAYSNLSAEEATTAINPVYVLIESIGKNEIEYIPYFNQNVLRNSLAEDTKYLRSPLAIKPNICLILLESFGKEYTGSNASGRPTYTPFLDSLATQSLYFSNAYANGLKSMDAVASVLAGIPAMMKQPLIGSLYTQKDFESVPAALHKQGYYSSFFHGADEHSMGFKPFLAAQGLDKYFGSQQYTNLADFDGTWGIYDGPFFSYFNDQLGRQKAPWFSTLFTLSSHDPYAIPAVYDTLPSGSLPIHKAVRYTDESLRLFLEGAKDEPWFANTVFIITADHTSINETRTYKSYRGKYEVPLLIYAPYIIQPSTITRPVQHVDVSATIKQLAGVFSQVTIGTSLLDSVNSELTHYDGNVFVYTTDSFTLEWSGGSNVKLYNYIEDKRQVNNLATKEKARTINMLNALKLSLQKYNYRMVNNIFTPE